MAKEKKNLESGVKISEELKQTLEANSEITEVHFTGDGKHYFNVHKGAGGKRYGRIIKIKKNVQDPRDPKAAKEVTEEYPDVATAISETLTRSEILGSDDK